MRYVKRPVVVDAIQWRAGDNDDEIIEFLGEDFKHFLYATGETVPYRLGMTTLEGQLLASPGDYIIRGVKGEHYPCRDDIFEATYVPQP